MDMPVSDVFGAKMPEKTVIRNGVVATMDKDFRIIEDGAVVIEGDKIIAVDKTSAIENKYKADIVVEAKGKAVLPGLINLHVHSHVLTRGVYQIYDPTKNMTELLMETFYPLLKTIRPEEVYAEAALVYTEAIKTGTTCLNDMYSHITSCADAATDVGVRAVISTEALDLAVGETLEDNERAFCERHNSANGRVKIWFGAEWVPVCSPEFLTKARELANKYKTGIHIHLNESMWEVEDCQKKYGKRPVEHAYDLGILGKDCVAAHCVWLNDREIQLLKETETNVSHNPASNMMLGNGIARIPDMMSAGINMGLGTDAPGNNVDMFEMMKYGSGVHRGLRQDIALMPPDQMLRMATINGAKALGMEKEIGSLEVGKKADLIIVNLETTRFAPVLLGRYFNVLQNLVYAAHGDDVETVIIDGKFVMENRKLKTVDEHTLVEQAKEAAESLLPRVSG
jgi:5-methylthioadenosine/S-adenosylhomocysteine deaminase